MRAKVVKSARAEPGLDRPLRVALLVYRGNPYCGGQGVYARQLSRALQARGHEVTVFSGQPYPHLDEHVQLVPLPSLDLYREPDPFRRPRLRELSSLSDVLEVATMFAGGFPEPRTFSLRARAELQRRLGDFDVVHDDQSLGVGLLGMQRDGWRVVSSVHHPIAIDRDLELAQLVDTRRAGAIRRWYRFARMQDRVAKRLDAILTVSRSSARDIHARMGVAPERIAVVPVGVDTAVYRPLQRTRPPGRIVTTASADVPLKGLSHLLEALAKVRTEYPEAHLVVVGSLREDSSAKQAIERLGIEPAVSFVSGISEEALVELYASATVAVVPSLYEGFSLPAIEAMACGVPLVATSGGALPEVVGRDGESALVVEPGDPEGLAAALGVVLADKELRARLSERGRARVLSRYPWTETARATEAEYRRVLRASC